MCFVLRTFSRRFSGATGPNKRLLDFIQVIVVRRRRQLGATPQQVGAPLLLLPGSGGFPQAEALAQDLALLVEPAHRPRPVAHQRFMGHLDLRIGMLGQLSSQAALTLENRRNCLGVGAGQFEQPFLEDQPVQHARHAVAGRRPLERCPPGAGGCW